MHPFYSVKKITVRYMHKSIHTYVYAHIQTHTHLCTMIKFFMFFHFMIISCFRWKIKCKKLERDVDRYKHSTEQATTRCEQLIREVELSKNHSNTAIQQLDHLKREFSELLVCLVHMRCVYFTRDLSEYTL